MAISLYPKRENDRDSGHQRACIAEKIRVQSANEPATQYRRNRAREAFERRRYSERATFSLWRSKLGYQARQRWARDSGAE